MHSLQETLRVNKKTLRKTVSASLQVLSASNVREQSRAISARILSLPSFHRCRSVSCYLSMPTAEVDTSLLVSEILRTGKTLFVPKIDPPINGSMDFLKIYGDDDLQSLTSGVWGIKEPGPQWQGQPRLRALDPKSEGLDMIILPGVAFDRSLSRIGHGKGYYDRFISTYADSGRPRPLLVALALREQVLDTDMVPVGNTDWKMDLIVSPDEIIGDNV